MSTYRYYGPIRARRWPRGSCEMPESQCRFDSIRLEPARLARGPIEDELVEFERVPLPSSEPAAAEYPKPAEDDYPPRVSIRSPEQRELERREAIAAAQRREIERRRQEREHRRAERERQDRLEQERQRARALGNEERRVAEARARAKDRIAGGRHTTPGALDTAYERAVGGGIDPAWMFVVKLDDGRVFSGIMNAPLLRGYLGYNNALDEWTINVAAILRGLRKGDSLPMLWRGLRIKVLRVA